MSVFEKIRDFIQSFMSVSLGVRILLGTLLGALGTSTLIGFLADLGAVNYALAYGARLPTEGVPYLRYAVTVISLSIFLIAFFTLFILNLLIRGAILAIIIDGRPTSPIISTKAEWNSYVSTISIRTYVRQGVLPALLAAAGLSQIFFLIIPLRAMSQWIILAFPFVCSALILVLARKPLWTKWVILLIFVLSIGTFLVAAFTPATYGKALNFARLGGGINVRLKLNCENKNPCDAEFSGLLFLRTTESFLLRNEKTLEYIEIPTKLVESVRYFGAERWGTQ